MEQEAQFSGGHAGWVKYLQNNLRASVPAKNHAPVGTYRVVVRFIVSKDGSLSDVQATTSFGYGMEIEVVRVITKGPKWIPAMQDGRVVKAYREQPVVFAVSEE